MKTKKEGRNKMLKNKKSLAVILSLMLLLGMACGAWAVTGQVKADGNVAGSSPKTVGDDIETTANNSYGAYAANKGFIASDGHDITTTGATAHGVYAVSSSSADIKNATIITEGNDARGVLADNGSFVSMTGAIITSGDEQANGAHALNGSSIDITATITTYGDLVRGLYAQINSLVVMSGDVNMSGLNSIGAIAVNNGTVTMTGNITVSGVNSSGASTNSGDITIRGNVTASGAESYGLRATAQEGTVNMEGGTLTVADETSHGVLLEKEGTVNLSGVTADTSNLVITTTSGTLNADGGSKLTGDVLHEGLGANAETLAINLNNATLDGALLVKTDGLGTLTSGTIDLTLDESIWNVTDNSVTGGSVIAGSNSKIDYNGAPENTTVIVDTLMGDPALIMKPGDQFIIKNGDSVVSLESSNPDVVEIVENGDGSISIISTGEGDAELSYTYEDENGDEQSVTIGFAGGDGISSSVEGTPDPDKIQQGDEVDLTYSYGSAVRDIDVVDVDDSGLAGSGLSVEKDAEGNILLTGTADEPGNYFFEVDMIIDGEPVTRTETVNIAAPYTTGGIPAGGIETGMVVDVEYDFTPYLPILIDNFGMAGSGLLADIVGGKVVLTGTAGNPGSYYYVVTLQRADLSTFTQKVPVTIFGKSNPDVRGGGSSNCNAGMGIGALVSLFGLALVMRKK